MPNSRTTQQIKAAQKEQQRKYAEDKPKNAAPSLTYGNSNTGKRYMGTAWPDVRAGAGELSLNGRGV